MNRKQYGWTLMAALLVGCSSKEKAEAPPAPAATAVTDAAAGAAAVAEADQRERENDPDGYFVKAVLQNREVTELYALVPTRGLNPPPKGNQALLISAVKHRNFKVAEFLVDSGYPVFFVDSETSFTALHIAAQNGDIGMTKLLVHHDADVNAKTNGHGYVKPLQLAQQSGNQEVVQFLTESGAQ